MATLNPYSEWLYDYIDRDGVTAQLRLMLGEEGAERVLSAIDERYMQFMLLKGDIDEKKLIFRTHTPDELTRETVYAIREFPKGVHIERLKSDGIVPFGHYKISSSERSDVYLMVMPELGQEIINPLDRVFLDWRLKAKGIYFWDNQILNVGYESGVLKALDLGGVDGEWADHNLSLAEVQYRHLGEGLQIIRDQQDRSECEPLTANDVAVVLAGERSFYCAIMEECTLLQKQYPQQAADIMKETVNIRLHYDFMLNRNLKTIMIRFGAGNDLDSLGYVIDLFLDRDIPTLDVLNSLRSSLSRSAENISDHTDLLCLIGEHESTRAVDRMVQGISAHYASL